MRDNTGLPKSPSVQLLSGNSSLGNLQPGGVTDKEPVVPKAEWLSAAEDSEAAACAHCGQFCLAPVHLGGTWRIFCVACHEFVNPKVVPGDPL